MLERRGFLTDVTGRTSVHQHYYDQREVRALQKVYVRKLTDYSLRARLAENATNAAKGHSGKTVAGTAGWLTAYLTSLGGTADVTTLLRDALMSGHSHASCYRARRSAGISSYVLKSGSESGSLHGWKLPGTDGMALDAATHSDVHVDRSVPTSDSSRLLRPADVARIFNLSISTLWRLESMPGFPKKYRLSDNAVGFRENEVQAWLESRRGVGGLKPRKRGRPRKEPQRVDAVQTVDIPPPAVTPASEQQRHVHGITSQLEDIHAKLDRLLSIWK
jgi:predicted DNA-binding transcriptional regulator AlpA